VTLLRRLGNHSRKNRLYRAFRELGRAIRTITLLRYLSEPQLREQITAITNRNEAFHGFADWLMFGGKLIGHNDPDYQEKVVKFNELIANCVIYSTACASPTPPTRSPLRENPSTLTTWPPSRPTSPILSAGLATGSSI
jgi:Tn3 transposase DDE domain